MPAGKSHVEESLGPLIFTIRGHRVILENELLAICDSPSHCWGTTHLPRLIPLLV